MTAEQAKKNLKDAEGKPQKGEGGAEGEVFLQNFLLLLVLLPLIMIGTFFGYK